MPENEFLPGSILSMAGQTADRLLAAGSGDAALLYLCLLRRGGYDPSAVARTLKWDAARLSAAHGTLVTLGLAAKAPAPTADPPAGDTEEPPDYSSGDIARELEDKASTFPGLVAEVQRRLGKILSTADLKSLYTMYDFLALPAEVICLLTSFTVEEMEHKYGPGHKPRVSQLRKEAFLWHRLGLDTAEAAEGYLKKQLALRTREGELLPLIGVKGRPPVEGERRFLSAWVEMGFPDEAIRLAYEKTVFQKQTMSWPYMNSILRSWHQKGLHTVAEIGAKDSARTGSAALPPPPSPAQTERRVADDVQWMREFLAKQKDEEG